MKYTIKSVSDEGIYYLVNGWNKYKTFWISQDEFNRNPNYYINKTLPSFNQSWNSFIFY